MISTRRKIVTAAAIIMLGNVLSRLLGLVREQVIAGVFGPSGTTSAFVAAATVPTMVYDLLIGGAISAALVPVFSDYAKSDRADELGKVAGTVLGWSLIVLVAAVGILELLAPQLVWLLAFGLGEDSQQLALTLVRIVLPSVLFLGLSGITTALLYSRQVFTYPAFCVAAYNAGIIVVALLLAPSIGPSSLVVGALIGAFVQLALQSPGFRGLRLSFSLDPRHPALLRIVKLYLPVALGLVIAQIGVIIDRNLASRTGEDSLAVMRFATTLVQFPLGLAVTAVSFAILPTLSRYGSSDSGPSTVRDEHLSSYKETLILGARLALLLIIPATFGLIALREPVIRLIFQHGVFDEYGTARTSLAFLYYAPQLPFVAVDQLLIFAFYARKNTLTPMLVGVLGVFIYVVAGLTLMGPMGMAGLVLANTIQNSLHGVILFFLLQKVVGSLLDRQLVTTVAKALAAAAVMSIVLLLAERYALVIADQRTLAGQAAYVGSAGLLGAATYFVVMGALGVEEVKMWWGVVRRRASSFGARDLR
ncbi:MAG: murein biosynthesis integral membrane protein MurJ [Chloroflexi bacterium]|nr:murein biosynthesis integral membrane protein MurJ [Chloroflexota bacterium]